MTLLLASGSPRRRDLLGRLEVPFEVVPSGAEERAAAPEEDPIAYALELAEKKAAAVAGRYPQDVILAADTVVAVDGEILGKPEDEADALRMLNLLRGKTHLVVTAVVVRRGHDVWVGERSARVTMRPFTVSEAEAYVATAEPMDKAGAYAVQGVGGHLVVKVEGCYNAVVGLPLCLTAELLQQAGVKTTRPMTCCGV